MAKKKVVSVSKKKVREVGSPLAVGTCVFIRTVTTYCTGRIVKLTATEIVLKDAAWVADTGRFSEALASGNFSEVEPFMNLVSVNRGAVVDVTIWHHALPLAVK